jgi:hypothetical protein
VIRLRIDSSLAFPLAAASTLVTIQLAAVLHYLPIEPLSASLLIFGGLYATINFSINYENNQDLRRALFEAGAPLVILGLIAIWLA